MNITLPDGLTEAVNGNETYAQFEATIESWPVIVAVIPIFYMIPTIFVIIRIFQVYFKSLFSKQRSAINQHIFLVLSLEQLLSFAYFLADYMMLRLPATGYFTAWCANTAPNHYLKLIFFFTFYFNYSAMIFPFLLCFLRLLLFIFPQSHSKVSGGVLIFAIPFTLIYPICFTFFLIPAVGYCRQLGSPYPFGSVSIYYHGTWNNMRNSIFHLINTVFWMSVCLLVNILLFIKLRKAVSGQSGGQVKSTRSHKAECSLTITIISMIMPYITYAIFTILYLKWTSMTYYMMIIRPFGNDCETVVVPWVFYMTHPVFQSRKNSSAVSVMSMAPSSLHSSKRTV